MERTHASRRVFSPPGGAEYDYPRFIKRARASVRQGGAAESAFRHPEMYGRHDALRRYGHFAESTASCGSATRRSSRRRHRTATVDGVYLVRQGHLKEEKIYFDDRSAKTCAEGNFFSKLTLQTRRIYRRHYGRHYGEFLVCQNILVSSVLLFYCPGLY